MTSGKHRSYILTINNFTAAEDQTFRDHDCDYKIWQHERGENGTNHIQGLIHYKNPRVWPKKAFPNAHIEPCANLTKSIDYCSKVDTRVSGPWEMGVKPHQGARTDLSTIANAITSGASPQTIAIEYPAMFLKYHKGIEALSTNLLKDRTEPPTVVWLYGRTGVGKTRTAFDRHGVANCYIKDGTMWWNNYSQQTCIVIDDFDGKWPYRDLLRLLDRYPYQGQYKGGYVRINSPFIYITCEHPPEIYYQNTELEQVKRRLSEIREVTELPVTMPNIGILKVINETK